MWAEPGRRVSAGSWNALNDKSRDYSRLLQKLAPEVGLEPTTP